MAGEYGREPCPDRVLDDVGGAFAMGAVGGSAWHFIKGMRDSPRGERWLGGSQAVRLNAPKIGGSFAVWGGLFSTFDCAIVYVRKKEDPWNLIASGFLTGGFLQLRAGPRSALYSAIFGGVILGMIEGVGIMLNRMTSALPPPQPHPDQLPGLAGLPPGMGGPMPMPAGLPAGGFPSMSAAPSSSSSSSFPSSSSSSSPSSSTSTPSTSGGWFGFGGRKKEEPVASGSSGERLNSFEANPPPATPDFVVRDDTWLKKK
eukprot:TRINITY_DN11810_c0_g1_i1.p1 TRINITY_DN11810_c0_g1~~TRINITY_DN11810_c0_g1_i1.p1  ORF type:complete len:258 (+),score=51.77 TRINITY_DN11810_c0_g1_i1:280-1053(+)